MVDAVCHANAIFLRKRLTNPSYITLEVPCLVAQLSSQQAGHLVLTILVEDAHRRKPEPIMGSGCLPKLFITQQYGKDRHDLLFGATTRRIKYNPAVVNIIKEKSPVLQKRYSNLPLSASKERVSGR